ncbi:hypothetical protein K1719_032755 [Acacia pycnantha]|nr:hypothetical protein K1719_032755 [Acacia pycnantha]
MWDLKLHGDREPLNHAKPGSGREVYGSKEVFLSDHFDVQSADTIEGKCTRFVVFKFNLLLWLSFAQDELTKDRRECLLLYGTCLVKMSLYKLLFPTSILIFPSVVSIILSRFCYFSFDNCQVEKGPMFLGVVPNLERLAGHICFTKVLLVAKCFMLIEHC